MNCQSWDFQFPGNELKYRETEAYAHKNPRIPRNLFGLKKKQLTPLVFGHESYGLPYAPQIVCKLLKAQCTYKKSVKEMAWNLLPMVNLQELNEAGA